MNEESKPDLLPAPVVERFCDGRSAVALLALANKLSAGGCCGKVSKVTLPDLDACGLTPIPVVYVSSIGQIIPSSGWRALCVYVYEELIKFPFPPFDTIGKDIDWGEVVAHAIKEKLHERYEEISR